MKVSDAIVQRRSIKYFDPDHRMTDAEIQKLIKNALLSPTAFNIQNWRFLLVQDPQLRQEIRKASYDQAQITDCSLLIILCADLKAWKKDPERYWQTAQPDIRDRLVVMIQQYYEGREEVQRDEAMRSCGLVATNLMLTAKEMGYDSCPMDGFDFEAVGELINLPADHVISMFVAIGQATQPARPKGGQLPAEEVVLHDRF